jgi:hypothetical protein
MFDNYLQKLSLSLLKSLDVLSVWQLIWLSIFVQINKMQLRKFSQLIHDFLVVIFVDRNFVQVYVFRSKQINSVNSHDLGSNHQGKVGAAESNTYLKMPISICYI